jgi:benzoyl-CoA reductase/2-hydroxyglutaryl-CoA dehydratase subunit BcrC/BadD/HgdB
MLTDREIIISIIKSFETQRNDLLKCRNIRDLETLKDLEIDLSTVIYHQIWNMKDILFKAMGFQKLEDTLDKWDSISYTYEFDEYFEKWQDKEITSEQFADGVIKYHKLVYETN